MAALPVDGVGLLRAEFMVADKLLPEWQGESLSEFVDTIRVVTDELR